MTRKLTDLRPPEYAKSIFLLLLEDNLISLYLSHSSPPSLSPLPHSLLPPPISILLKKKKTLHSSSRLNITVVLSVATQTDVLWCPATFCPAEAHEGLDHEPI